MTASAGFEKHAFISYAHLDNEGLIPGQDGWVTRFHAALEAMLSMRLGRQAAIWRDQKLTGSDVFTDEITAQFAATAVLISILTPRYVDSEWCKRELEGFCETAARRGPLVVDNKSRVIKVIKTPFDDGTLPSTVRDTLGYQFYVLDEGAPIELDAAFGPEMAQKFNVKLVKLAWDITQILRTLESPTRAATPQPSSAKSTVFLASCGYDRRDARDAIEADLRLSGYSILPDHELPVDEAAHVLAVQELLPKCQLAIHLIGGATGVVPDGRSGKSVVAIQNELAAAQSREAGLPRIIWLPAGTTTANPQQAAFIDALHANAELQHGADLVTADLETVKTVAHAALTKLEAARAPAPTESPAARFVYMIFDQRDRSETIALRKLLKIRGIEVRIPLFEGNATAIRQENDELLRTCDAVVVFYGSGNEAWRRTVGTDLLKASAMRAQKRPPPVFTYLAAPATVDKREMIALEEPNTIDALAGFDAARIEPLIASLQSAKRQ